MSRSRTVSALASLGGLVLFALAAPVAVAQIPDEFTNLKVLPKDISRGELMGIMRGYAGALGVRCIHCHLGDDPRDLDSTDFVSDEREAKNVARAMMRMVDEINGKLIPATGRTDALAVGCETCHAGLARPQSLRDVLAEEIEANGVDAAVARYRELREEYYGSASYDFGAGTLSGLAEGIARQQHDTKVALALIELNLEFNPDESYVHFLHGSLLSMSGDNAGGIAALERALKLDPGNGFYERALGQMKQRAEGGK